MHLTAKNLLLGASAYLLLSAAAWAETKITLSNVHLCCGQCLTAVEKTLAGLEGVKGVPSQKDKTVVLTADNDAAAQKAVDALTVAGFHGKVDSDKVKVKTVDAPQGNVKRLELGGTHNCCGACTRSIKEAIKGVKGVTADTVTPKKEEFVVEGDFSARELVDALLAAGFHVQVKK